MPHVDSPDGLGGSKSDIPPSRVSRLVCQLVPNAALPAAESLGEQLPRVYEVILTLLGVEDVAPHLEGDDQHHAATLADLLSGVGQVEPVLEVGVGPEVAREADHVAASVGNQVNLLRGQLRRAQ